MWIEIDTFCNVQKVLSSPSARKVWIEMFESVMVILSKKSPSARKVWIEISKAEYIARVGKRHLPRGRCGLKFVRGVLNEKNESHLPRGRCGLKLPHSYQKSICIQVTFREEGVD